MRVRSRIRFLKEFVSNFLEVEFVRDRLSRRQLHSLRSPPSAESVVQYKDRLFNSPGEIVSLATVPVGLRLITLREPDLTEFPFIEVVRGPRRRAPSRRLRCFVGHRFYPKFERSLRYNLR